MQNMNTRLFMKKHGAALVFSLCLMGAAAFTTVYTLNQAENTKEQVEQTTDLEEEARIQDANAAKNAKPADEAAVDGQDAKVSGSVGSLMPSHAQGVKSRAKCAPSFSCAACISMRASFNRGAAVETPVRSMIHCASATAAARGAQPSVSGYSS